MARAFANRDVSPSGGRKNGVRPSIRGFTLVELMIVAAVVAILAAIAVPSYQYAMVNARRGAAQGCLTEQAQYLERYHTTNMTYGGAPAPTCEADLATHYTVGFVGVPDSAGYTLQIVPQGRQATAETKCGTMSIDQTGKKSGTTADCWR